MSKVNVTDTKIKTIVKALKESKFFVAGNGCFDLPSEEYERFIKALMSNSPTLR